MGWNLPDGCRIDDPRAQWNEGKDDSTFCEELRRRAAEKGCPRCKNHDIGFIKVDWDQRLSEYEAICKATDEWADECDERILSSDGIEHND